MLGPFNSGSPSVSPIKGYGPPTTSTAGAIGQHYEDLTNQKEYVCFGVSSGAYIWVMPGANDAGDIRYNGRTVKAALETLEKLTAVCAGVEWDYSSPSTELTRLTRATDPNHFVTVDITEEPVPAVGSGSGSSPFDQLFPWAGMVEYNVVNGAIGAARGEADFSRTANDTVVSIPEFYFHVEDDSTAQKRRFYVSNIQISSDFAKHPGSGRYVGKYNTGAGYVSKSGLEPLVRISRATARTGSTGKGTGWYQYDYATWCAIWLLYLVEFADWDSQKKIGWGNSSSGSKKNTGGTDAMTYNTGKAYDDTNTEGDGYAQVQYRGIEDPWGNVQDWVDGVNFSERAMYYCLNPENYADDTADGYTSSGMTMPGDNNFISKIGFNATCPFAFVPSETYGDEASYIPDYASSNTGWRVLRVGGNYNNDEFAGLFYFYASNTSTNANANFGARLLFLP